MCKFTPEGLARALMIKIGNVLPWEALSSDRRTMMLKAAEDAMREQGWYPCKDGAWRRERT